MRAANDDAVQTEETVTEVVAGGTPRENTGTTNGGQMAITKERTRGQQRIHN